MFPTLILVLLNNMTHHRYHKERLNTFLTIFELNSDSIIQKWIENKIYFLDEERIVSFKGRIKENARFSMTKDKWNENRKQNSNRKSRFKYCNRFGHLDQECPNEMQKRPPLMPEWVRKLSCARCK